MSTLKPSMLRSLPNRVREIIKLSSTEFTDKDANQFIRDKTKEFHKAALQVFGELTIFPNDPDIDIDIDEVDLMFQIYFCHQPQWQDIYKSFQTQIKNPNEVFLETVTFYKLCLAHNLSINQAKYYLQFYLLLEQKTPQEFQALINLINTRQISLAVLYHVLSRKKSAVLVENHLLRLFINNFEEIIELSKTVNVSHYIEAIRRYPRIPDHIKEIRRTHYNIEFLIEEITFLNQICDQYALQAEHLAVFELMSMGYGPRWIYAHSVEEHHLPSVILKFLKR